jgi:hypothetical protein
MRFSSLRHRVQAGSVAHPVSHPMGTTGSFPVGKGGHSPPSSADVKNVWSYTSDPPIRLHVVVLNYARDTSSWCGALLSTGTTLHLSSFPSGKIGLCELRYTRAV